MSGKLQSNIQRGYRALIEATDALTGLQDMMRVYGEHAIMGTNDSQAMLRCALLLQSINARLCDACELLEEVE